MSTRNCVTVGEGFSYLEGPRWHGGHLWASDFYTHRVLRFPEAGDPVVAVEIDDQPSGLGWLPDGSLLIAAMRSRTVRRVVNGGIAELYADLSELASWHLNDLIVHPSGNAYVGNFGFDLMGGAAPAKANVVCIDSSGAAKVVAENLFFPNGMAILPDLTTLLVAESFSQRLTAFTILDDGSLTDRRDWAVFGPEPKAHTLDQLLEQVSTAPDGITLDAEGCVWFADGFGQRLVRTREGGEIVEQIDTPDPVFACMLGGANGSTLYACVAPSFAEAEASAHHRARLLAYEVDAPRAGVA